RPSAASSSAELGRAPTAGVSMDLKGEVGSAHISLTLADRRSVPRFHPHSIGPILSPVHVGVPLPGVLLSTERSQRGFRWLGLAGPVNFPQSPKRGFSSMFSFQSRCWLRSFRL